MLVFNLKNRITNGGHVGRWDRPFENALLPNSITFFYTAVLGSLGTFVVRIWKPFFSSLFNDPSSSIFWKEILHLFLGVGRAANLQNERRGSRWTEYSAESGPLMKRGLVNVGDDGGASCSQKPSNPKEKPGKTQSNPVKPSKTQSNPVEPSQT